jgi:hypothetical protein
MLWQLHHQFKDGHTEFKSQFSVTEYVGDTYYKWIKDTMTEFPLPEGAVWIMGNEEWEHFVWQKEKG